MKAQQIINWKPLGLKPTLDFEVDNSNHNFYAEGIVTSNSHAFAYSLMSFFTIWIKHHYPLEFFKHCLIQSAFEPSPHTEISAIAAELGQFNIKLLPPSLHKGNLNFEIDKPKNIIYAGLSSLKGFSTATLAKIPQFVNTSKANKFEVFLAANNAGLNITAISNLIKAGCLSEFGDNRAKLVLECGAFNLLTDKEKTKICAIGEKYNYDLFLILKDIKENKLPGIMKIDKKEGSKRDSRFNNYYRDYLQLKQIYQEASKNVEFDNFASETTILGYSFSQTLSNALKPQYSYLIKINEIENNNDGDIITFAGIIQDTYMSKTAKKKDFIRVYLSDETKQISCYIWDNVIASVSQINKPNEISKDWIAVVRGKKKGNIISVDNLRLIRKI